MGIIRMPMLSLLAVFLLAARADAQPACFYCGCKDKAYADFITCDNDCKSPRLKYAGCQCVAITLPDGQEPLAWQRDYQKRKFPNLSCYAVLDDESFDYNCIEGSFGSDSPHEWVWDEVDGIYGDNDGEVEVSDFDAFYKAAGYAESATCDEHPGFVKIALYGTKNADGTTTPTHAARQRPTFPGDEGGTWWESKEGSAKRTLHKLEDLEGSAYGKVIKCYEAPIK